MSGCTLGCPTAFFGTCVNNATCVCAPGRTGLGEGVDPNNCRYSAMTLELLWELVLACCAFVFLFCSVKLAWGLRRGYIDWEKLFQNTNFRLLATTAAISFFFGVYSGVRLGFHVLAFNDYLGVILYFIPMCLVFVHVMFMGDLLRNLLEGLLRSAGCAELEEGRAKWVGRISWFLIPVVFLPILGCPALAHENRVAMVRYFLVAVVLLIALLALKCVLLCCKAIELVRNALAATGRGPIRKIYWLMGNVLLASVSCIVVGLIALSSWFVIFFGYVVVILTATLIGVTFTSIICLSFDPSKFSKRQASTHSRDSRGIHIKMDAETGSKTDLPVGPGSKHEQTGSKGDPGSTGSKPEQTGSKPEQTGSKGDPVSTGSKTEPTGSNAP